MTKISKAQRAAIKAYAEDRGGDKYRITRDGEVHIYGQAPNSIVTCWWLASQSVEELLAEIEDRA